MSTRKKMKPSTVKLSEVTSHLCVPEGIVATAWPTVRAQAENLGIGFDPWQEQLGKLLLAKRADGQYAAGIGGACMSIPRQVGKTYLVGWMIFCLCLVYPKMTVIWTAHRSRTSDETFSSMSAMARNPHVAGHVARVRSANGQQAIVLKNGSRILFGAREQGFGRGFASVDVLVFDEAQILTESALSDMVPTTNASSNALILMMGTPPRPKDPSEAFANRRAEALAGDRDTLWVEFSAPAGTDVTKWKPGAVDWQAVALANPSFPHRTGKTAILRLRKSLATVDDFRREALGVWDEDDVEDRGIDPSVWSHALTEGLPDASSMCFAVRYSTDGSHVALAGGRKDAGGVVTVEAVRMMRAGEGTEWLVSFLANRERLARTNQIVVEGKSAASYLVDRLRAAGVPGRAILTPRVSEVIEAHALFLAGLGDGTVRHTGGRELTEQALAAVRRPIGSQGGFGWRAPAGGTCVLLDAVTLAAWVTHTTKRKAGRKQRALV